MVVVHHLENSRSQRILWTLEELGVPYEVKRYERDKKTSLAPESLKAVHPLGKSPVITDDDITVAESGAIIEYLIGKYGNGQFTVDTASAAHRDYVFWLHFAEGSLMPPLLLKLVFDKVRTSPMPFFAKPIAKSIAQKVMKSFVGPNIKGNLAFIEHYLADHEWFAGDKLTGADMQMSFPLEACVASGVADSGYPNIVAYVKRVHARPAYQKALSVGGPYDYA
ncbi:glutathione S-transferase [Alkalimarinus alittae]|uniref:Glutathione S-transferase n=1 Tax=Alkalimarinus alittae TaxID=2961619 RepID=A0ABY6MXU0_9ALTE|nr:glutathione S-transferase [Alkalimarinus alittae]UZE94597.1 glutathione S-transferase [Alkalimarinus alittae]